MIDVNARLREMGANCKYGAPMGRRNHVDNDHATVVVQGVVFQDGDYDLGGAYWGGGGGTQPLFCAMDEGGDVCVFLRAPSRRKAIAELLEDYPDLKVDAGRDLDEVVNGYLEAVLFAEQDMNREERDDDSSLQNLNYDIGDVAEDSRAAAIEDVSDFIEQAQQAGIDTGEWPDAHLGHDIYFSRNRHGTGFWDRGHDSGDDLHEIATGMGPVHAYVVDDTIHIERG
jgi:hypothetical protein